MKQAKQRYRPMAPVTLTRVLSDLGCALSPAEVSDLQLRGTFVCGYEMPPRNLPFTLPYSEAKP